MFLILLACAPALDSAPDSAGADEWAGRDLSCANPVAQVAYEEVGALWGLYDTSSSDPSRKEHSPVAFADLDGDGDDDVLLADRDGGIWQHRNEGGTFATTQVSAATGLTTLALGDIDGDADLDLFAAGKDRYLYLFENDAGSLSDVSVSAGLGDRGLDQAVRDGAFADYDNDGDADLYVTLTGNGETGEASALDHLFRNDEGVYTDVSELISAEARSGLGWQAVWFDIDRDEDLDLFVANAEQSRFGPSRMVRNDGGSFVDITDTCACGETGSNMGASAADFDGDRWTDLFVTNTGPAHLLLNDHAGAFVDAALAMGATAVPSGEISGVTVTWPDGGEQEVAVAADTWVVVTRE